MADQQHPITPPPELLQQWRNTAPPLGPNREHWIATQAARWGADAELEAILKIPEEPDLSEEDTYFDGITVAGIRENRRPKPPSLAEQAQRILVEKGRTFGGRVEFDLEDVNTICRALKRLQELEKGDE